MTDPFERRLAERLQARPLPAEIPDLGRTSVRRGQRLRRRRVAGVVGVLVVLLALPGIGRALLGRSSSEPPPVASRSSAPPRPAGPRAVILDPVGRQQRGEPAVATVRERQVWRPSGAGAVLPDDQVGTLAEYRGEPTWLTRDRTGVLRLNTTAATAPLATDGDEVRGVEPGPGGSLMVRTADGPLLWTAQTSWTVPAAPELRTTGVRASAGALWAVADGRVVRAEVDPRGEAVAVTRLEQWRDVVAGDPRSDRVVVTDARGCQAVLAGTTVEQLWRGCDWQLSVFSADGRYAAGRDTVGGGLGVLDLTTGGLVLAIDPESNPVGPRMVFDGSDRLNLRVGDDDVRYAFMACDLEGDCWLTTSSLAGPLDFVLPNRP